MSHVLYIPSNHVEQSNVLDRTNTSLFVVREGEISSARIYENSNNRYNNETSDAPSGSIFFSGLFFAAAGEETSSPIKPRSERQESSLSSNDSFHQVVQRHVVDVNRDACSRWMNHRSRGWFPRLFAISPCLLATETFQSRDTRNPSGVESRQDRLANSFSARGCTQRMQTHDG